jgi:poly(A) polymerase
MKLQLLYESAVEEATIDFLRKTIENTPYEGLVYIAGGYVRDEIMGKQSKDIDLVIDQDQGGIRFAEWICKKLGIYKEGSNPVIYPRFGTAMFTLRGIVYMGQNLSNIDIECVMPRAEENVRPVDRKSIIVKKTSMKGDSLRRDLTINALYKNVSTGQVIDFTGHGIEDIKKGVLRTPTAPDDTFGHPKYGDPLRMLRVIRFAAKYGFDVDEEIIEAIERNKHRLEHISKERIRDELEKMLISPNPVLAIRMLIDTGLIDYVIPEMKGMVGLEQGIYHAKDAFGHTMDVLGQTPPRLLVRLAALLHDIGKPETRTPHPRKEYEFLQHEKTGADKARIILKRLKFPNDVVRAVTALIDRHMGLRAARGGEISDKSLRRFRGKCERMGIDLKDALALMKADYEAHPGADEELYNSIERRYEDMERAQIPARQEVIGGKEIMQALGIPPGPLVGAMKKYAEELFYEDPDIDKETILVRLKEKFDVDD